MHICIIYYLIKLIKFSKIYNPSITNTSINFALEEQITIYLQTQFLNELSMDINKPLLNSINCLSSYLKYICKSNYKKCDIQSTIITLIL